jgi:hypothetical protein
VCRRQRRRGLRRWPPVRATRCNSPEPPPGKAAAARASPSISPQTIRWQAAPPVLRMPKRWRPTTENTLTGSRPVTGRRGPGRRRWNVGGRRARRPAAGNIINAGGRAAVVRRNSRIGKERVRERLEAAVQGLNADYCEIRGEDATSTHIGYRMRELESIGSSAALGGEHPGGGGREVGVCVVQRTGRPGGKGGGAPGGLAARDGTRLAPVEPATEVVRRMSSRTRRRFRWRTRRR